MVMVRPGCEISELGDPPRRLWPCADQCATNRRPRQSCRTWGCSNDRARATGSRLENSGSRDAARLISRSQASVRGSEFRRCSAEMIAMQSAGFRDALTQFVAADRGAAAVNPLLRRDKGASGSSPFISSGKSTYRSKSCGRGRPEGDAFALNPTRRCNSLASCCIAKGFAGRACKGA